nr:uncharacterized protein LOC127323562 [Lolium perenne]
MHAPGPWPIYTNQRRLARLTRSRLAAPVAKATAAPLDSPHARPASPPHAHSNHARARARQPTPAAAPLSTPARPSRSTQAAARRSKPTTGAQHQLDPLQQSTIFAPNFRCVFIQFIKFVLTGTAGKNRAALPLRLHHHALAPPGSFRSPHAPASSRQTPPANSLPASRAKLRPPACLQLPRALPPGHHHPLHARSPAEPHTRPLLRRTPAQAPRALSRPWPSTPAASARHPTHCAPTRPPCAATQAATSTNHRRPAGARFSLARFRPLLHLVNPPASKSIHSRAASRNSTRASST